MSSIVGRTAVASMVAVACLGSSACRGERVASPPAATAPAVLFFGDSITRGHGLSEAEAFPALVQKRLDAAGLDYRCLNAGISGETSADGLARVERYLSPPPRLVVVELGANDVFRGIDRRHTYENLVAIVEAFEHAGSHVIVAATLFPGVHPAYERAMDRLYRQVAEDTGAALIPDLMAGVAGVAELNLPDRIHPNARGHRRLAATAWPFVERSLYAVSRDQRH